MIDNLHSMWVTKTPCTSLNRATASSFSLSPLARKTSIITSIGILYLHILTTWFWGVYFFGYNHNWNTIHLTLNRIIIIILRSHRGLPRNVGGIRVAHRLIFLGVVFFVFDYNYGGFWGGFLCLRPVSYVLNVASVSKKFGSCFFFFF